MKANTHNDCLVNLPKAVYSVMATFLSNWRRYDALVTSMEYYFLFYFINLRPEVGDAFYTGTIAPGKHAEMRRLMEEEMVVRERRWREVGFSVVSQETDNEGDGEPGREPNEFAERRIQFRCGCCCSALSTQ